MRRLFVLSLLLCLAAPLMAQAENWEKSYALTGRPDVYVKSNDAHVRVEARAGNAIAARVYAEGWRIGENVHITDRQDSNRLELEVKLVVPPGGWTREQRGIRIEILMPADGDLRVNTDDGHIQVGALRGRAELRTGDGNITLDGASGTIRLVSDDGNLVGHDLSGTVEAMTSDGNVTLRGKFQSLEVRTGDGNIVAEALAGTQLASGWSLHSGDGTIVLRIPQNLAADLDAHTGDGEIYLDFPVTVSGTISKTRIEGPINGGGPKLILRTGDGAIRIERSSGGVS